MAFFNIARCLSLLAFTHRIIAMNISDSGIFDDETRQPRISGRIVKLYSGSRPDPILCTEEGFKSDPNDCSIFYRCVNSGRGKFTVLRFNCGPGTVYDPDIEVCNHPRSTKRAECNGGILYNSVTEKQFPSQDNEIDSELEPPSPIDFVTQFNSQRTTKRQSTSTTTTKQQKNIPLTLATTIKSVQLQTSPKLNDDICVTDGFVGDIENCRTFYRCVANGRGGFIKYEFSCSESTMWDDDVQGCNHAWAIKRRRCGRDSYVDNENVSLKIEEEEIVPTTVRVKYNYGNKNIPKITNKINQETTTYTKMEPKTTSTEKNIKELFINNRQSYGSGSENDNDNDNSTTSTKSTPTTTTSTSTSTTNFSNKPSDQNTCTSSGFMGDSNDCRKFYRCVDNGKGSYTKYEFTCGEGTVWDSSIEACNHAWAVEKCGGSSSTSTTQPSKSTTQLVESTKSTTESNDYEDPGYNNPQQPIQMPVEPEKNTNQDSTTTTTASETSNNNECVTSGFIGDKNECKKFYRCVDDGKGGFIKYDFTCGEGTLWDSEIESCNHESVVKDCSKRVPASSSTTETLTTQKSTTEQLSGSKETTIKYTTTTTQVSTTTTSASQVCTMDGFIGDSADCKKFYRCVDNGHGGFIKYEFSCGEGTVWDPEIQSCNHPTPNKKCGSTDQQNAQNPDQENQNDETDNSTTQKSQSTTENHISSTEKGSSTTEKQTSNTKDKCDNEGFYGDSSDCKKFYRCVDNGNGGYAKYDFTCGEGTMWDQEIQGCNHASLNSKCFKETSEKPSNQNQQTTSNAVETDSTEKSSSGSTAPPSSKNDVCKSEGFYANSNDCKMFYRCVSDDKGGYTKYDFSCGEGTIWVQEIQACDHDNDLSSCAANDNDSQISSTSSYSSTTGATSQPQMPEREDDEYTEDNSGTNKPSSGTCTSEGYFPDENDCRKFYRCVDNGNGGYTKYDFTCGEGTAWDTDLQTCNHENDVESCKQSNQSQPPPKEEETQTTQETTTTKSDSSSSSSASISTSSSTSGSEDGSSSGCNSLDKCEKEGYFGNSQDCTKFYRCVDNGHGGLTKYDFDCGEGTIWDQDVQTCNHPGDVQNPSCNGNGGNGENCGNGESSGGDETGTSSTTSQPSSQTSSTNQSNSGTSDSSTQSSNCSQDSSEKPKNNSITCPKAGFYANPNDCKKFYRCVDWDGDNERYSVFHFDCGEGTIWDPELETCNYEDSVYPPRDCSRKQSASETESSSSTTQESTTEEKGETTTSEKSTTDSTTTEQATTEKSTTTTKKSTTTEKTTTTTTTEQSTTEEQTTTEKSTTEQSTTEESTTKQSTTEQSTTEKSTTEESTTKQSTTEESTTQQSTTKESTTEQSTTEKSTTEESTTEQTSTEQSTTEQSTTEQSTTEQSTTEQSTTEQSTTEQSTTEQSTTEQSTTEQSTTDQSTEESTTEQSTTEGSTTEDSSTESSSSNKDCPETDNDQYMYVCPTGFRRHPKYCNLFYQCTEDDDTHEVKVAVFNCPNNTIYDETKNQCVEESEADKKCDGEMAERRRFKRLDSEQKKTPIVVSTDKRTCKSPGHYPFEKNDECSPAFMKCIKSKTGIVRGFVYRCPDKHVYWSVSRRCEPISNVRHCKNIDKSWSKRWEIPYETKNIAP